MSTRDIGRKLREKEFKGEGKRYGLVIGIDSYEDERLPDLKCAENDAQAIYNLMIDPECGFFDVENVDLLTNQNATKKAIIKSLSKFQRKADKSDTFWLYYSGHTSPEGNRYYWVPCDAEIDDLMSDGISQIDLMDRLNQIVCERKVTILDTCHAQAMAQKPSAKDVIAAQELLKGYSGKGNVTIMSSDGNQKSVELEEKSHGAFTYFLIEGLKGSADINNTGVVTLNSLWSYLPDKVSKAAREKSNPQTPILKSEITLNFPLTINKTYLENAKKHKENNGKIIEKLQSLCGWGNDRLSTREVETCINIINNDVNTKMEEELKLELNNILNNTFHIKYLKLLIQNIQFELTHTNNTYIQLSDDKVNKIEFSNKEHIKENKNDEISGKDTLHLNNELLEAIKNGEVTRVTDIASSGVDVDRKDKYGKTPLILAAYYGHKGCLVELINAGANLNIANENGDTPLHTAAILNNIECMNELIRAGAKLDLLNNNERTPLYMAVWESNLDCVENLIKAGANINKADLNGWTPLYRAVYEADVTCVKVLIKSGANLKILSKKNLSPLDKAIQLDNKNIINILKNVSTENNEQKRDYIFNKATGTLEKYKLNDSICKVPKTIGGKIVKNIGYGAFSYCVNLNSIELPNTIVKLGDRAFYQCKTLTDIEIPQSTEIIGREAFYNCELLTSIVIPNNVISIDYEAYYNCSNLSKILIPDSVKEIGYCAFKGCNKLIIYCTSESYAKKYAIKYSLNYKVIGHY